MTKRSLLVSLGLIAAILLAAMAFHMPQSSKNQSTPAATQSVSTDQVMIQDYMFNPMAITVKVGTTVTWKNADSVHHSVVADKPSPDAPNGPLLGKGEHYSFTFTKKGTYTFHCGPHPYMHGTVVVN